MDNLPTIDWEVLYDLKAQVGEEVMANLFGMFFADTTEQIAACRDRLSQGDFNALAEVAHMIKGSAGSMGFAKMRTISSDLQLRAEGRADPGDLATLVEMLAAAYDDAKRALGNEA